MLVTMLLNVKIHVLVKIEVLAVSLISEGLQPGHDGVVGVYRVWSGLCDLRTDHTLPRY